MGDNRQNYNGRDRNNDNRDNNRNRNQYRSDRQDYQAPNNYKKDSRNDMRQNNDSKPERQFKAVDTHYGRPIYGNQGKFNEKSDNPRYNNDKPKREYNNDKPNREYNNDKPNRDQNRDNNRNRDQNRDGKPSRGGFNKDFVRRDDKFRNKDDGDRWGQGRSQKDNRDYRPPERSGVLTRRGGRGGNDHARNTGNREQEEN